MSWRPTAILFAILVVVAGAVLIFQRQPSSEDLATATPPASFVEELDLFEGVALEDVVRLEIVQAEQADEALFERDDEGAWAQVVPTRTQVFSATLTNQVTGLLNSSARRSFAAEGGDLAPYGLEQPAYTIVLAAARDGSIVRFELALGSQTPTGDAYYVQKLGDPRVHLLSAAVLDGLLRLLENVPLGEESTP